MRLLVLGGEMISFWGVLLVSKGKIVIECKGLLRAKLSFYEGILNWGNIINFWGPDYYKY